MHENPAPGDWLMWRRTQNGWGYSPLDQINRDNIRGLVQVNRSAAIYGNLIIDTANDGYVYALDAQTGRLVWETEILNLQELPARHSTGPIIATGMVVSGRSCRPWAGPEACIIAAHDRAPARRCGARG